MEDSKAAATLLAAERDGVVVSLAIDGRIFFHGSEEARERWAPEIKKLSHLEMTGAALSAYLFTLGRNNYLDGHRREFVDMLAKAAAAGVHAAKKEIDIVEGENDPPNAS